MKNFVANAVDNSKILSYIKGQDNFQRMWTNSIFFTILRFIFNAPISVFNRLYCRWEGIFSNSLFMKLVKYLSDKFHILIGLVLVINIIVPDKSPIINWYNKYEVFMVALLAAVFILKMIMKHCNTTFGNGSSLEKGYLNDKARSPARIDFTYIDYASVLFFAAVFISGTLSVFPDESYTFLVFYLITFLMALMIVNSVDSFDKLNIIIKLITAATFLTAIYGIYQWKVVGIAVDPSTVDLTINQGLGGRIYSTMGNENVYGELLVLTIPYFAYLIINEKPLYKKALWFALLMPVMLVLLKTASRSAWIGFAVSAVVFVFFWNIKLVPVILILGAAALPFLPSSIYRRILTISNFNDSSIDYRIKIINSSFPMLKDYWSTGIGLGHRAVSIIFQRYKTFGVTNAAHSHNLFLQIWLESGILALTSFLLMVFRMLRNTLAAVREKKNPSAGLILIASVSAITGLLVMGMADHIWFYNRILFIFWVNVSVVFVSLKLINKSS